MSDLKPCPLCGSESKIGQFSERVGWDEYMRFVNFGVAQCQNKECGLTLKTVIMNFADFSTRTVEEFRKKPDLRKFEEQQYNDYVKLKLETLATKWNTRV